MDRLDAALHWLLQHDPQRALYDSDEEYGRSVGIEVPVTKNRQRREERRWNDLKSAHPDHCRCCVAAADARSRKVS